MASVPAAAGFESFFRQPGAHAGRGKFLSRLFGIFSEEIVRIWARDPRAPYEDLGRPTVLHDGRRSTLDYCFRCRRTGKVFVVEQKCEIEYQNYRYLTLERLDQLSHHAKPAFSAFLAAARPDGGVSVQIAGQAVVADGAILMWGAVSELGREAVLAETGLHDVLALADIVAQCAAWKPDGYESLIADRAAWSGALFEFLAGDRPIAC